MNLAWLRDAIGLALLAGGLCFTALGVFGLFRMPDVYTRMHAGSKAVTLGASMILVAVAFLAPLPIGLRAIAITLFLFLTTPVATFASARAAHRRREPMALQTVIDELEDHRRGERAREREPYPMD
ncbi:monovalent cation/H(+) antiporter subunit G [Vulgatibacter sp.]|uniref:monovalent cation/H(+) antiporter subunit G n=1 Tax=Vulgatibacter sp. TaxID=1971226 RepID=UPI0035644F26